MQRSERTPAGRTLGGPASGRAPGGPSLERWTARPAFADSRIFVNDLEFTCALSADGSLMEGELHGVDAVRAPGSERIRPSVLATIADVMAGIQANHVIGGRLPLTLDIDVRTASAMGEWIAATARLLKVGRSIVSAEVAFVDLATGEQVALSYLTFMPSPRSQDMAPSITAAATTRGSMDRPFPEHVGARVLEPGLVEIDHDPFVTQASNTLQGGIVALLGEYAAESLTGTPVADLDTRYLATVRVGPARARAVAIGPGLVRVEIRDAGNGDRLAARSLARLEAPRGQPPAPVPEPDKKERNR